MGLYFGGRSCKSNPSEPAAKAPNPSRFFIEDIEQVGQNVVMRIRYPNCDNYEGLKIVLYRNIAKDEILFMTSIDPHFSKRGSSPFARFEPTDDGWEAAIFLARSLRT